MAIDKKIVMTLGINGDSTYVEQEITEDVIVLRVKQWAKEGKMKACQE